jgi:hypothetical protein
MKRVLRLLCTLPGFANNEDWDMICTMFKKQGCYQTPGAKELRRNQFPTSADFAEFHHGDIRTDGPTDRPTNIESYRGATSRLKTQRHSKSFNSDHNVNWLQYRSQVTLLFKVCFGIYFVSLHSDLLVSSD